MTSYASHVDSITFILCSKYHPINMHTHWHQLFPLCQMNYHTKVMFDFVFFLLISHSLITVQFSCHCTRQPQLSGDSFQLPQVKWLRCWRKEGRESECTEVWEWLLLWSEPITFPYDLWCLALHWFPWINPIICQPSVTSLLLWDLKSVSQWTSRFLSF